MTLTPHPFIIQSKYLGILYRMAYSLGESKVTYCFLYHCLSVSCKYIDISLALCADDTVYFTTDRQSVIYYFNSLQELLGILDQWLPHLSRVCFYSCAYVLSETAEQATDLFIEQTCHILMSHWLKGVLHYRAWHNGLNYRVPIGRKVNFKVQRNFILVRLKVNLCWTHIILRLFYVTILHHL